MSQPPERPHDSVFMQTWVPSSLAEVGDIREVEKLIEDKSRGASTIFDALIATPSIHATEESSLDDGSSESSVSDTTSADEGGDVSAVIQDGKDGHRPEGISKQDWKKIVKEERREQRKTKVPKHLKQKRNLKKYGKK